ncbi:hypothetical protein ABZ897_62070 [Nonomuraea sp. NPDC046802]|uniref:hypothetical protein n=1 Tax=Nonomuraea sp. NPDC046802 TaxID=3154919 RepID=UPI0033C22F59
MTKRPVVTPIRIDARELQPGHVVEIHESVPNASVRGLWTVLDDKPRRGKSLLTTEQGEVIEVDVIFFRMAPETGIPDGGTSGEPLAPKELRKEWKHFIVGHPVKVIRRKPMNARHPIPLHPPLEAEVGTDTRGR